MLFNGLWLIACLGSMCTSRYQLPHQLNFLKRFQGFWSYVITRWWFHFCSPCSPLFSRWWCIFTDKGVYLLIQVVATQILNCFFTQKPLGKMSQFFEHMHIRWHPYRLFGRCYPQLHWRSANSRGHSEDDRMGKGSIDAAESWVLSFLPHWTSDSPKKNVERARVVCTKNHG